MNQKYINTLISIADKFDREDKPELAKAVDTVLKSNAARPKAPLKNLNDDVKKSLIVFLVDAEDAMHKGCKGIGELSRRMRYFDIADVIKELGLDKAVKDMEKAQECLDSAKKEFYTMTFGKRPSKEDLNKLLEELGKDDDDSDDGRAALDFFNSDQAIDSPGVHLKEDLDEEEFEMGEEDDDEEEKDLLDKLQWEDEDEEDDDEEVTEEDLRALFDEDDDDEE